MEQKLTLQSLPDTEVFSPCSFEHQDVYMYEDDHYSRGESDSPTYLDISASKSSHFPSIKQEPDTDTLMSWTQKHPEHWTQSEILDWIYFVAGTIDVDQTTIRGEGFQNISGPELCRMTEEDFSRRDPVNGKLFYDMFRMLFKDATFIEPQGNDFTTMEQQYHYRFKTEQPELRGTCNQSDYKSKQSEHSGLNDKDMLVRNEREEMQVLLGEFWYPIDLIDNDDVIDESTNVTWNSHSESGYSSSDGDSTSDSAEMTLLTGCRTLSTGSDLYLSDEDNYMALTTIPDEDVPKCKQMKSPVRRKKSTNGDGEKTSSQNRGRKPGQISKGNHLWEFIRDLLKDPKFNPHLLRWEEKETGVFRFVQSEAVAQMWGRKKNNPGMTYEKLSRAMRYYYKRGILDRVDGRRLVYKFGVNSHGWK